MEAETGTPVVGDLATATNFDGSVQPMFGTHSEAADSQAWQLDLKRPGFRNAPRPLLPQRRELRA